MDNKLLAVSRHDPLKSNPQPCFGVAVSVACATLQTFSSRMKSFALLALLASMGILAIGCQTDDESTGETAVEQSRAGDAVVAKLDAIVIPIVDFENANIEEALEFLRLRSIELDPDREPTRSGISFVVRPSRTIEDSTPDLDSDLDGLLGLNPHSASPHYFVNYVARDVPLFDVLSEVARQARLDAYLTSVGVIMLPEGKFPFPTAKGIKGEVWKVLRKSE